MPRPSGRPENGKYYIVVMISLELWPDKDWKLQASRVEGIFARVHKAKLKACLTKEIQFGFLWGLRLVRRSGVIRIRESQGRAMLPSPDREGAYPYLTVRQKP